MLKVHEVVGQIICFDEKLLLFVGQQITLSVYIVSLGGDLVIGEFWGPLPASNYWIGDC